MRHHTVGGLHDGAWRVGRIARTLFHCCPCLVLGEVDGFGRMFSHGSTDFCLSGIFFSADLYESSVAFRFSSSCGVNGGLSADKLRPGISDWAEATPVNRTTTAAAWITFRNIFWAKCAMRLICSHSREAARAEFRTYIQTDPRPKRVARVSLK